jgi:exodeoxyribonuclease VIII
MKNVMLDLETMGVTANAAIIAIGAVGFNLKTGELGPEFYQKISLTSSMENGGVVDASTILWWMAQSQEAKKVFDGRVVSINQALYEFSIWMNQFGPDCHVWGNGASFDNTILTENFRRCGIDRPWKFTKDRCYRTVKSMFSSIHIKRLGTHHNALDDAKSQALHLICMIGGQ